MRTLQLPVHLASGYKSSSQIARVITEPWAADNLFCLNCGGKLDECATNTKTTDLICVICGEGYQLKSQKTKFGNYILGAE